MDVFENLENLNVSEECFNDIISIIEEIISETKKVNKEAHQDAIFKKLNPEGEYAAIGRHSNPRAVKNLEGVYTGPLGARGGAAKTMKDYREVTQVDSTNSAPTPEGEKTDSAKEVRRLLGRDKEFSNVPAKTSKSHEVAKKYMEFKQAVKKAKNN